MKTYRDINRELLGQIKALEETVQQMRGEWEQHPLTKAMLKTQQLEVYKLGQTIKALMIQITRLEKQSNV